MSDLLPILRKVAKDDMALPADMEWHELFNTAADEIERLRAALREIAGFEDGPIAGAAKVAREALGDEQPSGETEAK